MSTHRKKARPASSHSLANRHENPSHSREQTIAMMRRTPFFSYPAYQPFEGRRPSRSSPPVITIPVLDASSSAAPAASPRSSQPPAQVSSTAPAYHPVAAATKIQSCFRGFVVRRCKPLPSLRAVAAVQRQLDDLHSQMQASDFLDSVVLNEKKRLRFTESIMALILRLDAIEGCLPEIRMRRKEATKKAIWLQDAVDDLARNGGTGEQNCSFPIDRPPQPMTLDMSTTLVSPAAASSLNADPAFDESVADDSDENAVSSTDANRAAHCTEDFSACLVASVDVDFSKQSTVHDPIVARDSQLNSADRVKATSATTMGPLSILGNDGDENLSHITEAGEAPSSKTASPPHEIQEEGSLGDASNFKQNGACWEASILTQASEDGSNGTIMEGMECDGAYEDEPVVADQHERNGCVFGRGQGDSCPVWLTQQEPEAGLKHLGEASETVESGMNRSCTKSKDGVEEEEASKTVESGMNRSCIKSKDGVEEVKAMVAPCPPVLGERRESQIGLLENLVEECKHLKSLLSQLCTQQHLQNQSIGVLSSRIARLEQDAHCRIQGKKKVPGRQSRNSNSVKKSERRSRRS